MFTIRLSHYKCPIYKEFDVCDSWDNKYSTVELLKFKIYKELLNEFILPRVSPEIIWFLLLYEQFVV